jgi:hypothetical protein
LVSGSSDVDHVFKNTCCTEQNLAHTKCEVIINSTCM